MYVLAYAFSQVSSTESTDVTCPRSTCHHWLSTNAELQRVDELPSFAYFGSNPGASVLEPVAGLFKA